MDHREQLAALLKEVQALPWYQAGDRDYDAWLGRVADFLISKGVQLSEERPSPLTFDAFSAANLARCEAPNGFNHALGSWSLSDWFTAILGELGEAANVAKKLNRIRDGIPGNKQSEGELREMLRRELADVFIYLDLTAQRAGFRLGDVVPDVFERKSAEIGYPVAVRDTDSLRPPCEKCAELALELGQIMTAGLSAKETSGELAWADDDQRDFHALAAAFRKVHDPINPALAARIAVDYFQELLRAVRGADSVAPDPPSKRVEEYLNRAPMWQAGVPEALRAFAAWLQ